MADNKHFVCLANSRKHSGRCLAGKEILPNGYGCWIRPVSARQSAEISKDERRYENGIMPKVLDVISVPIIAAKPYYYQSENHVIGGGYWVKTGTVSWQDLGPLVDTPQSLWANGDSSRNGSNDRVRFGIAKKFNSSLTFIMPENLTLSVVTECAEFASPRRRVRAEFQHLGTAYNLVVTDPVAEAALLARPDAAYKRKNTYLCISLSEPYTDGYCYKLVATAIGKGRL